MEIEKNLNNNQKDENKKTIKTNIVENSERIDTMKEKDNIIDIKNINNKIKRNNISIQEKTKIDNEMHNYKSSEKYLNSNKINNIEGNSDNQEDINSSDSSSDEEYYGKYSYQNDSEVCGIKNIGNNCYLNSGLQILADARIYRFITKG